MHQNAELRFKTYINKLYQEHLPSKHPFFTNLSALNTEKLTSPDLLGHLHPRYQAACHATRVMVYHIPHLDSPALRVRKLRVINDDDGLINGDTHHYQLTRAFVRMGAKILLDDEEFGSLDRLKNILDPITAEFILLVQNLYPKSLSCKKLYSVETRCIIVFCAMDRFYLYDTPIFYGFRSAPSALK